MVKRFRTLRAALCVALLSQLLALLFVACERRPLEVIVDESVRVRIVVKWKINFVPLYYSTPNGMTVMIWGTKNPQPIIRYTNEDNLTVQLEPDVYHMVIFNELSDDYYPYMRFVDADSYDRIAMRSTTFTVGGTRGWDDGVFMNTPEDPRIAVALDTFDITSAMAQHDTAIFIPYEEYRDNGYIKYHQSEMVYEIPEVPWPMTVDLFVELKLKNYQSLKSIDGAISGMADGFYLSHIIRTSESGALRFNPEEWSRTRYQVEGETDSLGVVTTRVASFGLPYGKELLSERDSTDNVLDLDLTLTNDSVLHRRFNVGKYIRYITPSGEEARIRYRQDLENLRLEILLPDIIELPPPSSSAGAGFDARVDEWENGGAFSLGGF